jgi:Lar family restriction alleviation protein
MVMMLDPCPFCGSTRIGVLKDQFLSKAECQSCGATGPKRGGTFAASDAWNTRVNTAHSIPKQPKCSCGHRLMWHNNQKMSCMARKRNGMCDCKKFKNQDGSADVLVAETKQTAQ